MFCTAKCHEVSSHYMYKRRRVGGSTLTLLCVRVSPAYRSSAAVQPAETQVKILQLCIQHLKLHLAHYFYVYLNVCVRVCVCVILRARCQPLRQQTYLIQLSMGRDEGERQGSTSEGRLSGVCMRLCVFDEVVVTGS